MKVLFISNMYPGKHSYLGTFIKQQVEDMENEGLCTTKVVKNRIGNLNYVVFILKNLFYLLLSSYDIVHAYYGFHSALFAAIIKRRPLIITFVGSDALREPSRNRIYRILQKFVISRSDHIIAVSSKIKNVLVSDLGADSNKISVITFGIDFDLFQPSPQDKVREKLGFPSDMKLILFPSSPQRIEKRFDIFTKAVELVQREDQNILPVILSNNRRSYSEVPLVMNACDVLVLTSDSEGSPTVIKEALACNLPVVSVDVGDAREIIKDVANCYVCKQEPVEIAQSIRLVLDTKTRADGRDNIKHLSSRKIATRIIELYAQVIQDSL